MSDLDLGPRIRAVRLSIRPKLSEERFAGMLGTTRSAVHEYERSRVIPNDTFLQLVCRKFDVSYEWLTTGKGEMRGESDRQILEAVCDRYNLDANQRRLMEVFLFMDPEKRQDVSDAFFTFVAQFHEGMTVEQLHAQQAIIRDAYETEKKDTEQRDVDVDVSSVS